MDVKSNIPEWANYKTTDKNGRVCVWELKPEILPTYSMWYRRFSKVLYLGENPDYDGWETIEILKDQK